MVLLSVNARERVRIGWFKQALVGGGHACVQAYVVHWILLTSQIYRQSKRLFFYDTYSRF